MITCEQLYPLARRIFWGYVFLLFNFSLTLNDTFALHLLPNTLGWFLLARAAGEGASLRPSLKLLVPLCLGLAVWNVQQFVPTLSAQIPSVLSLLASVVSLYAHFQLLTDLAALADQTLPGSGHGDRLRSARTVVVVIQTIAFCSDLFLRLPELGVILVLAVFFVNLYILAQLWALCKALAPSRAP